MKVELIQYVLSLKMDENEKNVYMKAVLDRDDWEIVSNVYEMSGRGRVIDISTSDNELYLDAVPLGYFSKEDLLNYIEELQKVGK